MLNATCVGVVVESPVLLMLEQVAVISMDHLKEAGGTVCLQLTDDQHIAELNRQYRGIDGPTDVLSFAWNEGMPLKGARGHLGDIVISVESAQRQANQIGHSLNRELAFLEIHGILHLMGFDHVTETEEQVMIAAQRQLLGILELEKIVEAT